ncbi:Adaptor protein complex AP-2 alpha subunit [Dipodascopsis tothii]|uniref:Adaptor protein complex AP-2 alpha subunit n=1 Tax=Dipodascopsis tothii TaxID=44089 RepID=UPI0034CFBA17
MSTMRGLVQFIADLRNARARELEEKRINKELANIRNKFNDANLNGYNKKKYVCKLLYIYILGWNVDFGHLEALNLISSNKFSEKQIGYLATSLLLNENHVMINLVVNSIRKDLMSPNEVFVCLALHAIANLGGREMAEQLGPDVHKLLVSPVSSNFTKKKAALTLLRLYRKAPTVVFDEWAERLVSLMDDPDFGVAISVTSLVSALAQDKPELYRGSFQKAAFRLERILIEHQSPAEHVYYNVPSPWLLVKLLRLLQYYPPPEEPPLRNMIEKVIKRVLEMASEPTKNVQQNNAQNAVLFEAVNVAIHVECDADLMDQITFRLGYFISSRETNLRYLGLDAMAHLAARSLDLEPVKKHQETILHSLRDRDISVRRKGLDLLYSMCDYTNSGVIVGELLKYLEVADYAIREDMVIKIAVLAEKTAMDYKWYVDTSIKLISIAGDYVSEEVWQRVVQVISNNDELQPYAAQIIVDYLRGPSYYEALVKIGAYVLGEFGHLIVDTPGYSPIEQFVALQDKFPLCSAATKAMLLSTFVKFVNLFPEIKPNLLQIFQAYTQSLDSELQQRACEYFVMSSQPNDELLRVVCDEMPPFPERASVLLSRLHEKHAFSEDKRTWFIGGKDAASEGEALRLNRSGPLKRAFTTTGNILDAASDELESLNLSESARPLAATPSTTVPRDESQATSLNVFELLSADWEYGFTRLLSRSEGVLYEDSQIQIGLRSEYRGHMGCLILYFNNKSKIRYTSLATQLFNTAGDDALSLSSPNFPDPTLRPQGQSQQMVLVEAKTPFEHSPVIKVSYLAGSLQSLYFKLPVVVHKFMDPVELDIDSFFKRWKQIGSGVREAQRIFKAARAHGETDLARDALLHFQESVAADLGWGVSEHVDPNPNNTVGAGVINLDGSKLGCLVRIEPNFEASMYRVTVRATDEAVPGLLLAPLVDALKRGPKKKHMG